MAVLGFPLYLHNQLALRFLIDQYKNDDNHFRKYKMNSSTILPARRLRSSDVKLLRVFQAVANSGSFAGAQSLLNISAASVSTQMSALESRLGMRLCSRGRAGFRLTEEGFRVLEASQKLFSAHDIFSDEIWSTKKLQRKVLRVGIVDSVISNNQLLLSEAFRQLCDQEGHIEFHISSFSPSEIEQGVLNSEIDIGIGVFLHRIPSLIYDTFLITDQILCCGSHHPCFERAPYGVDVEEVATLPYVTRSYMGKRSMVPGISFNITAETQSIESTAMLVLTGHYIAHLPAYYVEHWITAGEMRVIQPDRLGYKNSFGFAVRESTKPLKLVKSLVKLLVDLHHSHSAQNS